MRDVLGDYAPSLAAIHRLMLCWTSTR